jgi:hypothetical protein
MMDYLTIGCTPAAENCVQVSSSQNYHDDMRKEVSRYRDMIQKRYPFIPSEMIRVKSFQHDFGTYMEVCVVFSDSVEEQERMAYFVENTSPEYWNDKKVYTKEEYEKWKVGELSGLGNNKPDESEVKMFLEDKIKTLRNYGVRTELAKEKSYKAGWSNGSAKWWVYPSFAYEKGKQVDLDANELLIPSKWRRVAQRLFESNSIIALPLYSNSFEVRSKTGFNGVECSNCVRKEDAFGLTDQQNKEYLKKLEPVRGEYIGRFINEWRMRDVAVYEHKTDPSKIVSVGYGIMKNADAEPVVCIEDKKDWSSTIKYINDAKAEGRVYTYH